ncbi:MAG: hypothetical protein ACRERC_13870 [Candidatus Binatia bacterium]
MRCLLLAGIATGLSACGSDDCGSAAATPPVAVLGAFPAELAALLERATVDETITVDGRVFRRGRLGGVPVVLAMTGIGLLNATRTTQALLDHFDVAGVVMSGVAGSTLRIGDVVVPETWTIDDGPAQPVDPAWLRVAERVANAAAIEFERCTYPALPPSTTEVCMAHDPLLAVGGAGRSTDSFGANGFICTPGGGDIFACDVEPATGAAALLRAAPPVAAALSTDGFIIDDMESAAVAHEAAARGVPFLAFRAVSDGAGDPLGLPGFPAQFFAYYRLAANNAAAATEAFLASPSFARATRR